MAGTALEHSGSCLWAYRALVPVTGRRFSWLKEQLRGCSWAGVWAGLKPLDLGNQGGVSCI